jgi:tetratricopeptide (TPR) repeat protein
MRAFLSHSSLDKPLVERVAKELGRQFCLFDQYSFETGEEFAAAITRCLDLASTFVLFASKASLASVWVALELDEARARKLREAIGRTLVYLIDDTTLEELPEWLRRALVRRLQAPRAIARDIRSHLDELLRDRRNQHFVGRGTDVERFEQLLTPIGSPPPRAFFVCGLPGIGRRSLIRRSTSNLLGLSKHLEVRVNEGDSLNDLCAKVADLTEPYSTADEFRLIFQEIQRSDPQAALTRLLTNVRALVASGDLPIFLDDGGLLDGDGRLTDPVRALLGALSPDDEAYMAFASVRRPQQPDAPTRLPVLHLQPLGSDETRRLIVLLSQNSTVKLTDDQVRAFAEYVAGYPPAAYFAVQHAQDYGVDLVLAQKRRLVEFRTGFFLRHLAETNLDDLDKSILQVLARLSPLPLQVVCEALGKTAEDLEAPLIRLIDLALVIPDGDGLYRISDPIVEAAASAFGFPTAAQCDHVARSLDSFLLENPSSPRRLDLSRLLFRVSVLSGSEPSESAVRLAADLIVLTEEHYHAHAYSEAVKCGRVALEERPESLTARTYLIRALVQLEEWDEAEKQLAELRRYAPARDVHFQRGLLERSRGRSEQALKEFEEAAKLGRRGAAISRELGQCYFQLGDLDRAARHAEEALKRHPDNRFIVDLWTRVLTLRGEEQLAREALERQRLVDGPLHYFHRLSRVEFHFGHHAEARDAAVRAFESSPKPPFAVMAHRALCEIAVGNLNDAEALLGRLDGIFANVRHDIRTGLRCRLEIANGNYGRALRLSDHISDRATVAFKSIRRESIRGALDRAQVPAEQREALTRELAGLDKHLDTVPRSDFPELDLVRS